MLTHAQITSTATKTWALTTMDGVVLRKGFRTISEAACWAHKQGYTPYRTGKRGQIIYFEIEKVEA